MISPPLDSTTDADCAFSRTLEKITPLRTDLQERAHYVHNSDTVAWAESRAWLMLAIFAVSLFAASFPSLSRRLVGLRIPGVVFFIGKHFGTGVILATAFVHLLQDAFEALLSPVVIDRWGTGKWTGMIVLSSLLLIFLVEYISTSFVDRLHSYSSVPPSPSISPSRSSSRSRLCASPSEAPPVSMQAQLPSPASSPPLSTNLCDGAAASAAQPQARAQPHIPTHRTEDADADADGGHTAGAPLPFAPPETAAEVNEEAEDASERSPLIGHSAADGSASRSHPRSYTRPRPYAHTFPRSHRSHHNHDESHHRPHVEGPELIFAGGHHRHEPRGTHASHHGSRKDSGWRGWFGIDNEGEDVSKRDDGGAHERRKKNPQEGRRKGRRHERGHSHAHAHAHADMEAWRGRSVSAEAESDEEATRDGWEHGAEKAMGRRRQVVGMLMLQIGIMLHSLVIGLTLAITSGPEFTSLVAAIIFHQLFEGLSLGIRIASLPSSSGKGLSVLKPGLALSFALTTPVGIAIGLGVFGPGRSEGAKLQLIRGLMSALSAGMLIYAGCVEMLAGDFILDPHLWRVSVRRQMLALGALLAGAGAMGIVGIWD
ncbi:hypothetical protein AcV7_006007 [Taiwanofungus camphoratus]|nr:hypothetical protein AcV7_006007 [Antrodia cinnamomea]